MSQARIFGALLVATIASIATSEREAHAVLMQYTIDAVQDTTITAAPSSSQTITDNGNQLRIRNASSSDRTSVLVQFDLSQFAGPNYEIKSAKYQLYDLGTGGNQASLWDNTFNFIYPDAGKTPEELTYSSSAGVALDKDGLHQENATYASWLAAISGNWTEDPGSGRESLTMTLSANNSVGYHQSDSANQAALDKLNELKDEHGWVLFLLWRDSGSRTFSDIEGGFAPQLLIEVEAVPEPSAILLGGLGLLGMAWVGLRKRK